MASAAVREKAERLVREGRVHERPNGEEFDVQGDTGWYSVLLVARRLDLRGSCTCKRAQFGGGCSHIEAAKLTIAAVNGGEVP